MVEIIRNKWCEDLEDLLQCPICMVRPKSWIYQCIQGHHICEDCKTQLALCPTCSQRWSSARNRLAESLCNKLDDIKLSLIDPESEINKLLIPDRVSIASQTEAETGIAGAAGAAGPSAKKPIDDHNGPYPCRMGGCNANLYYAPLMNHIKTTHSNQYIEFPMGEGSVFQHIWFFDFVEQMTFDRVFVVPTMGTFFLKLSSDCFGNFSGFVLMLHNGFIAKQFTYQLEIACCAEHTTGRIYTGEICSCRTPVTVLHEKCLHITRTDIQRMLEHQKNLTCTVLLGKKPQTDNPEGQPKPNYSKKKYPNKNKNNPGRPSNQPPKPPTNGHAQDIGLSGPSNRPMNRPIRQPTVPNGLDGFRQDRPQVMHGLRDMNLQPRLYTNANRHPPTRAGSIPSLLYPNLRDGI